MNTQQDYFELFGIAKQFRLDLDKLLQRYRELQREFHPDRHAGNNDVQQRLSLQASSYINQAYECLRSPRKRAQYLLSLQEVGVESNRTNSDTEFLIQQIEWREALSSIRDEEEPLVALDALEQQVSASQSALCEQFESRYDACNYSEAAAVVEKMQFVEKMMAEIKDLENRLYDD